MIVLQVTGVTLQERTQLFGQTIDAGGRPFATNWDEWADLLLVAINTPADAPFL